MDIFFYDSFDQIRKIDWLVIDIGWTYFFWQVATCLETFVRSWVTFIIECPHDEYVVFIKISWPEVNVFINVLSKYLFLFYLENSVDFRLHCLLR